MPQTRNIGGTFLDLARASPDVVAVMDEEAQVTFAQLAGLTVSFALHLLRQGVRQGSTIAVRSDDPAVILASVFASALLGCRWVFARGAVLHGNQVEVTHYFQAADEAGKMHPEAVEITEQWASPPPGHDNSGPVRFPGYRSSADPWLIFPSSGTTGVPKYMQFSHRNIFDRITATRPEFTAPAARCVFLFGLPAAASLIRSMSALLSGWGLVHSVDPAFWYSSGVTRVFGSPSQIRHLLLGVRLPGKLEKALVGGDLLSDDLARDLFENFEEVVNTYGSTEANLVVENHKLLDSDGNVTTRTVRLDSEVQVVDENDREMPVGQEGIVRIRNGYLATGYLNSPEAEATAFRNGWFYPGDRGLWDADGNFRVTGRQGDLFNLGGTKVNAAFLDFLLQTVPGVRDAISFLFPADDGGPDRLMAFLEVSEPGMEHDARTAAKLRVTVELGVSAVPERFMFVDRIPRNPNGKPDRAACVRLVEEGRARIMGRYAKRE